MEIKTNKEILVWVYLLNDIYDEDTFVLIFRINTTKVSFELFKRCIIFYQRNFYRKMFDVKL